MEDRTLAEQNSDTSPLRSVDENQASKITEKQVDRTTKEERLEVANHVIRVIARHGRKFFSTYADGRHANEPERITRFELDARGRIWLIDKYTQKRIFTHFPGRWRGFSDGGTLRSLIESLQFYIRNEIPIPAHHFGLWPKWIQDGDLWGYGSEEMIKLRKELTDCPAIEWGEKENA